EAAGQDFVAPRNGVLSMIYNREAAKNRLISNQKYFLHPVSRTLHRRDIFSPVGAHISPGAPPARMRERMEDYLRPAFQKPRRAGKRTWSGRILKIDRFGNIITNFHTEDFPDLEKRNFAMVIGPQETSVLAQNYAECGPGELFVIVGSSGYL